MSGLSGYLDMHVATAVRKGEKVVRLQRFRKEGRRRPALTLLDARAWGQKGQNDLDQRDRGLVASRQVLTVQRAEVDGVPAVMSNMSAMDPPTISSTPTW